MYVISEKSPILFTTIKQENLYKSQKWETNVHFGNTTATCKIDANLGTWV